MAHTSGLDTSDPVHNRPPEGFDPSAGRRLLGHPPGLFLLFFVEMWERFSYYGMRALLVLYLITLLAAHQIPAGRYTNDLRIDEVEEVAGQKDPKVLATQSRTLTLLVGSAPPPAETAASEAPKDAAARLVLKRLKLAPDPKHPGTQIWAQDDAPIGALEVVGQTGAKGSFSPNPAEFGFELSNPTDHDIAIRFSTRPTKDGEPLYFMANKSSGIVTATIKPDSARGEEDEPYRIIVQANTHDSGRQWTEGDANFLYGWYTGLAYLLPVFGGILADKLLGTHRSMVLGGLVIAIGHILLAVSGFGEMAQSNLGMSVFVAGLATIIIGTGYFKPTVSVMVGQLYRPGDAQRDGGFSIFYMGINLGAFLCAFVCGTLGQKVGWHWGFGSAAVGMILGLVTYMIGRPSLLRGIGDPPPGKPNVTFPLLLASCAVAGVIGWMYHEGIFSHIRTGLDVFFGNDYAKIGCTAVVLLAAGWFVAIQRPGEKGPVAAIFLFMLFNAFFWIAFEQAGSTLNVFAERSTNLDFLGFEIPATWFQSVNALLIILFAPAFAWLWGWLGKRNMDPSQPMKIALGLILLGLGYFFMVWGAKLNFSTGAKVSMFFLMMTYLLHTLGELCLSPTGLSFVSKVAPVRFVSLLMGIWFISSFIANLGGGLIASKVEAIERGDLKLPWSGTFGGRADYFMLFVVTSIGMGLLVMVFVPVLKKLYGGKE